MTAPPTPARPQLHAGDELSLGLDIGGTSAKSVLLTVGAVQAPGQPRPGRILASGQSARYSRPDAPGLLAAIAEALAAPAAEARRLLAERPGTPLLGVGLCCPGLVDPDTRTITRSVNLPALVGLNLDSLPGSALDGLPGWTGRVAHCPDARAAATDWWANTPAGFSGRLLALSLGTGVGACVLDDGRPLRVSGESPGHLGQIDVGPILRLAPHAPPHHHAGPSGEGTPPASVARAWSIEEPIGPDGGRGGLEAFVGLPALRDRYGPGLGEWLKHPRLDDPPIVALVRALRIAHAIYRPQHVVLLGGVGLSIGRAPIAAGLRAAVADRLTSLARDQWTLQFAQHLLHAAAGAARLVAVPDGF